MSPEEQSPGERNRYGQHRRRKTSGRVMKLIRRIHLYAGVFFFPWVCLYGVTGAMFSHQGLFPEAAVRPLPAETAAETLRAFPTASVLADDVATALEAATGATVRIASEPQAEFTNPVMFRRETENETHILHIDPVQPSAWVVTQNRVDAPRPLLPGVHSVELSPNPQQTAEQAARALFESAGITAAGAIQPHGWTKLSFVADIDGTPARITYVLKDGHVDVTPYNGEPGMSLRQFLLRMHTTHGHAPHWNGRRWWILAADGMAIAMVFWGFSGLLMWWQIRRTRLLGIIILSCSALTAAWLFIGLRSFYAATLL